MTQFKVTLETSVKRLYGLHIPTKLLFTVQIYFSEQDNKICVCGKQSAVTTICHQYHETLTGSFQDRLGNKSCMCHTDTFLLFKEKLFTHTSKYFWTCCCSFIDYSILWSIVLKECQEGTQLIETASFRSDLQCIERQFNLYYQTIHLISFLLSESFPN